MIDENYSVINEILGREKNFNFLNFIKSITRDNTRRDCIASLLTFQPEALRTNVRFLKNKNIFMRLARVNSMSTFDIDRMDIKIMSITAMKKVSMPDATMASNV